MLRFNNVSFQYNASKKILENLNFEIEHGEFVSLVGKSGCGKSTIFRLICGFEKCLSGSVEIRSEAQNIGYMPQKGLLFPWATVRKNLALPLEIKKVSAKQKTQKIEEILASMKLLQYIDKYPDELSGGIRQRIAFARTILTGADILLLDEPFSALDYFTRLELQEWLSKQWIKYQKTIIFITHDVEEALFLSSKVFLCNGSPLTKLESIAVNMGYPRTIEMLDEPDVISKKQMLIRRLRDEEHV